MSTPPPKDTNAGLLSKVAKFVRNPTVNWSDLDKPVSEADSGYSKQALKEMIERKRRNDFVRKREFDQLRKLRNRDPGAPAGQLDRPSFYQSSMSSNLDERKDTLKKIDEIEAQMSKQWWKGKQAEGGPTNPNFPVSGLDATAEKQYADGDFEATKPSQTDSIGNFARTQLSERLPTRPPVEATGSGFSSSKLFAEELSDDTTDPELEEASIRFANGDDAGAESGLKEALERSAGASEYEGVWIAALFDLYRATQQQEKFDTLALDAASRYGRSAPPWHNLRGESDSEQSSNQYGERTAPQGLSRSAVWEAPAVMDLQSVGDMHLVLANEPLPWLIGWTALKEIQPDALKMLSSQFAQWCNQPVRLQFDGGGNLERVLRMYTVSGDKSVNNAWWRMRMDALRIMRKQDEFELAALDYCVTFEVSPPSWQDPKCVYVHAGVEPGANPEAGSVKVAGDDLDFGRDAALTEPMGLDGAPGSVVALAGEVKGDAAEVLLRLEASRQQGQGRLVVSCAQLVRVDFSAAGSILNWVASRQEEGLHVQFREVHRLVGAFFNVIGINEHAKVVLRAN